jgi:hypothetical protein
LQISSYNFRYRRWTSKDTSFSGRSNKNIQLGTAEMWIVQYVAGYTLWNILYFRKYEEESEVKEDYKSRMFPLTKIPSSTASEEELNLRK